MSRWIFTPVYHFEKAAMKLFLPWALPFLASRHAGLQALLPWLKAAFT